jgi:CheY-like chemotaxis protein
MPMLRILVAEDNEVNRQVVDGMLRALGYEAHMVEDGLAALEALEAEPYDVVLLDIHMPRMDGIQTARTVVSRFGARRPRLIALTADVFEEQRHALLEAGLDDFLPKPLPLAALREALLRCATS